MNSGLVTSRPEGHLSDRNFDIGDVVVGVPRHRTLTGFAVEAGCDEGVEIESLEPGTTLTVQTLNTQYHLTVLNGARGEVLAEGGHHFPEATTAVLQGSTAGASLLKAGWITPGLHLELRVGPRLVITSRVREVTIDAPISCP
jgi:hypothetical protein